MLARTPRGLALGLVLLAAWGSVLALVVERTPSRFDAYVIPDPASEVGIVAETSDDLPDFAAERAGWDAFVAGAGGEWRVHVDRRSGAPVLVEGSGITWFPPEGPAPTLGALEARARGFVAAHSALFKVRETQLVLDADSSGPVDRDHFVLAFDRVVDGVGVERQRFLLYVTRGRLVAFGADAWGVLEGRPQAIYDVDEARQILHDYMGLLPQDRVTELEAGTLVLVPAPARGSAARAFAGPVGAGTSYHLAYRFALRVAGERGTWVGKVDAVTGEVIALVDDNRYAQVRGGAFPVSNDGLCPDGCEQADYPMPYADVTIGGSPQTAGDMGVFACAPAGSAAVTTLAGPYIRVQDQCGAISLGTTCDSDQDLGMGPGTDCATPPGSSPGDTHASRSSFYHLNRVMEKGRAWLPANTWLQSQLVDNVNIDSTCNAFWDGAVNFYRSGGGCRNTGEIAGVFVHEWGHGLDANDGGGYDNPSEAYADVVAFFQTHASCIGRGFFISGNCGGYGDACLNCTGVRDQDWDQHASHTPATPQGFLTNNCSGGGGPCGKEEHCEAYVSAEAIWDLAYRDLPALGLDAATAWQLADKLFYKSRQGSGGNAYNCALPNSDGCGAGTWFTKFRTIDDDDGNLANGTPHAAAIFAAFARHNIACGTASDASNQNSTTCPLLAAPTLAASHGAGSVSLSWTEVPGAASYLILRNELGCDRGHTVVATVAAPQTTYVDTDLPNGFQVHYAVQAQGTNSACESALSNCLAIAPIPRRGELRLDRSSYGCSDAIQIKVLDLDLNGSPGVAETVGITVSSTTEPIAELVTLTETGPDTGQFTGAIATSSDPVTGGDGVVQASDGDLLTVTYRDRDDGTGVSVVTYRTASADCAGPTISSVRVTDLTDASAIVRWETSEPSTSRVDWGTTAGLGSVVTDGTPVTSHALTLAPLPECGRIHFTVSSTDPRGNTTTRDAGGSPFSFNASIIPGAIFKDAFEASSGWTLEGEWQIGAPQGLGNGPDPSSAFDGTKVLGHDLTGLGGHPGDYEIGTNQRAISPVINASGLSGGQLKFRRWLNVIGGGGPTSSIEVRKGGTWNVVWSSGFGGVGEEAWSLQTINISQYADGNNQLQIAFKQLGGPNQFQLAAGWNVDRLIVRSASNPDFSTCGGCAGAPSFGGVGSATDLAPCGDSGVHLAWDAAAAWGTGGSGTYSVYRDTVPNFTPSAANRIATGLSGTSYTDAASPNGVTLYYLVRAENNETCSSGPNNGGVTDANLVYASARDDTSQPAPGDVGATLHVANVNSAHVQLSWSAAPEAARYHVYRADAPQGPFSQIADVVETLHEDRDEIADPASRYYKVMAVDACGNEGP
jgi:hypothetical protein